MLSSRLARGAVRHALLSAGVEAVLSQALAVACITPVSFLLNRGWAFR